MYVYNISGNKNKERKGMKKANELNIREIEKKIGYTFKDKSLLTQAFTRTSFCNEINPTVSVKYHSNEVLEFFGDGVLSLSIISFLLKECTERYEHGIRTELGEGDFSNIKSKLSDKQNLSKSMKALGLEKHLLMGEGDYKLGIQNEPSVMEDLFESIVGAIFIDSDMSISAVIKAVSSMLDMSVYTDRQKIAQSAKNALQEWCADKKRRLPAPRYETISEDGPDHKKTYVRGCFIGEKLMGRGIGKNFKIADSEAAEDALKTLMAQAEHKEKSDAEGKKETVKKTVEPLEKKQEAALQVKAKAQKAAKIPEAVSAEKEIANKKSEAAMLQSNKKQGGATVTLKSYAASNKKISPTFRDLGERRNGNKTECAVECLFMNEITLGTGATRLEAREAASQLMVEKIGIGKKTAKKTVKPKEAQETKTSSATEKAKKSEAAEQKVNKAPSNNTARKTEDSNAQTKKSGKNGSAKKPAARKKNGKHPTKNSKKPTVKQAK